MRSDQSTGNADPSNATGRKTLGILQAGRSPEQLLEQYPDYDQLFIDMLGGDSFDYRTWAVIDHEFPKNLDEADAWLITGSRHGAYEPHEWIPPLERLIHAIYAKGAPMVGICFGHQIIAQTLGGTVEKYAQGWSVGRVEYTLEPSLWGASDNQQTALMAFHQDQVTVPPNDAVTVGSTDFCRHAALTYGSRILTIQPHPEFDQQFVSGLLEARGNILPADVLADAHQHLHEPLDRDAVISTLRDFLNA